MQNNISFTIIKPDAFANNFSGKIIDMILSAGFKIKALKTHKLTTEEASKFYEIHKDKGFFGELIEFMTSGPIMVAIVEKNNAVLEFRKLIGKTNPKDADEGTIRKCFAESLTKNAIHGSDSDENAIIESGFFFSEIEIL
ncbi:MAG: nucleoside-diphosphate kinase [Marinifilaceae bacterium]|jgi:nucleoside-diphosphate kinase|nr:nucleoside-diphosphate kinase [Marinifilaceae bacterium]